MANGIQARWVVSPSKAPELQLHCGTCANLRAFVSSGRVRLNANGKRLDAWLIYNCSSCGRTWNRPLIERASVRSVEQSTLDAMQQNDPTWVRDVEFDLNALRRRCDRVLVPSEVVVRKFSRPEISTPLDEVRLEIETTLPTSIRLDRLLASELRMSRSQLQRMIQSRRLKLISTSISGFRKPLQKVTTLKLPLGCASNREETALLQVLFD